jgi:hypothetical protein
MNKIFLLPTQDTLDMLQAVFSGSPIIINWDLLGMELGSSVDPVELEDGGEYRALTGPMNVFYDSGTSRSHLLMSLVPSDEMVARHKQIGDAWGRNFVPYMNMCEDPLMRRARKAFMNSVSTRLVDFPLMLTFHNETLVVDDSVRPAHAEFYDDVQRRGQVPIRLFTGNAYPE